MRIAVEITLRIATSPFRAMDRLLLPKLGATGIRLVSLRIWQLLSRRITDGDLVCQYQQLLETIPMDYFIWSSDRIAASLYPGALETVAFLAERMPVGIVSLALLPTLEAVDTRLQRLTGQGLAFKYGNNIGKTEQRKDIQVLDAKDKERWMLQELENNKCKIPLVVGNGGEDIVMADLARNLGGFALGLNPALDDAHHFSECLKIKNWTPILSRVKLLLGAGKEFDSKIDSRGQ